MSCRSCTYLEAPALDRWHCVRCGQPWEPERPTRRGLLWTIAGALVLLAALEWGPGYVDLWRAMLADFSDNRANVVRLR